MSCYNSNIGEKKLEQMSIGPQFYETGIVPIGKRATCLSKHFQWPLIL